MNKQIFKLFIIFIASLSLLSCSRFFKDSDDSDNTDEVGNTDTELSTITQDAIPGISSELAIPGVTMAIPASAFESQHSVTLTSLTEEQFKSNLSDAGITLDYQNGAELMKAVEIGLGKEGEDVKLNDSITVTFDIASLELTAIPATAIPGAIPASAIPGALPASMKLRDFIKYVEETSNMNLKGLCVVLGPGRKKIGSPVAFDLTSTENKDVLIGEIKPSMISDEKIPGGSTAEIALFAIPESASVTVDNEKIEDLPDKTEIVTEGEEIKYEESSSYTTGTDFALDTGGLDIAIPSDSFAENIDVGLSLLKKSDYLSQISKAGVDIARDNGVAILGPGRINIGSSGTPLTFQNKITYSYTIDKITVSSIKSSDIIGAINGTNSNLTVISIIVILSSSGEVLSTFKQSPSLNGDNSKLNLEISVSNIGIGAIESGISIFTSILAIPTGLNLTINTLTINEIPKSSSFVDPSSLYIKSGSYTPMQALSLNTAGGFSLSCPGTAFSESINISTTIVSQSSFLSLVTNAGSNISRDSLVAFIGTTKTKIGESNNTVTFNDSLTFNYTLTSISTPDYSANDLLSSIKGSTTTISLYILVVILSSDNKTTLGTIKLSPTLYNNDAEITFDITKANIGSGLLQGGVTILTTVVVVPQSYSISINNESIQNVSSQDEVTSSGGNTIPYVDETGLLLYYNFDSLLDGKLVDLSKHYKNAGIFGGTKGSDGGTAYYNFDGVDDYVMQDNYWIANELVDSMTLEARVRSSDANGGYILNINDTATLYSNLTDNIWHYLTATYDGQNAEIFKDGISQGSYQEALTIESTARSKIFIGAYEDIGASDSLKGDISYIKVFNYKKNSDQICREVDKIWSNNGCN